VFTVPGDLFSPRSERMDKVRYDNRGEEGGREWMKGWVGGREGGGWLKKQNCEY